MIQPAVLPPGSMNQLRECKYGFMLYNSMDPVIGLSLELYGEFADLEVQLLRSFVGPGDTVVDAGANIGTHSLAFARLVGPTGAVLSFEPQRVIFQILCANFAVNGVLHGHAYNMALGAEDGLLHMPRVDYGARRNFGAVSLADSGRGDVVQVAPLDSLDLPACRLIKADVEGMEREVLRGAQRTIERHRPFLYLENNQEDKAPALIRHVADLGYRMYWQHVPYFNPDNHYGNADPALAVYRPEPNMFCVPAEMDLDIEGLSEVQVPVRV